jgi:hypothetical protein
MTLLSDSLLTTPTSGPFSLVIVDGAFKLCFGHL